MSEADATIIATGPLTSDGLAQTIQELTGSDHMAFYDAAAPIVMADSLNMDVLFRQSRYGGADEGDYLNAAKIYVKYAAKKITEAAYYINTSEKSDVELFG